MSEYATLKSRYKLIDKVGIGGMSTVYVARDLKTNAIVAIKVLHPQFAIDKNFINRFFREIKIIATLNHPNILKLYDYGVVEGTPYFVTEYIQGKTLKELLNEGKKFSIKEVIRIIIEVLKALSHANSKGVIAHRDIKPGNIMIDKDGNIKLMDFGIAKFEGTQITQDTIMYTPTYASPEQIKGENVDIRSDLYSLGCTFYELLTGRPPFLGTNAINISFKHINEQPQPPSNFNKEVSKDLDNIILKLLSKNPSDRYQTPEQVINDLEKGFSIKKSSLVKSNFDKITKDNSVILENKKTSYSFSIKGIYLLIFFLNFLGILTLFFVFQNQKNNLNTQFSIIQIFTEPSGVDVYINDNFIGKSPIINYKINPGEYKISFIKEGYEKREEIIRISKKENKNLNFEINKLTNEIEVNINSIPQNANIYINDNLVGTTPLSYKFLINDVYNLKITKEGYETYQEKIIINENKKEITVTLKEKQVTITPQPQTTPKVGYININSNPPYAKVYVNDEYKGLTPLKLELKSGTYKLKLEKENYLSFTDQVQIKENVTIEKTYSLFLINLNGKLTVYSFPEDAEVYLNGEFIGYTPINKKEIKPGKYRLDIKLEGYMPIYKDIEIKSGEELKIDEILAKISNVP